MKNIRRIAQQLINGEVVKGNVAAMALALMSGDAWRLGVVIALEYLENGDVETARAVLEDMLGDDD